MNAVTEQKSTVIIAEELNIDVIVGYFCGHFVCPLFIVILTGAMLKKGKIMSTYKLYAQKSNYYGKPTDKDLENACINSYSNKKEDKKLRGLDYFSSYDLKSGLNADVYYNDDYLVVVFRGTQDFGDVKADIVMGVKKNMPQQFYEADRLWNRLQDNDMFPDRKVIATGHSLGGSISVYLGNKYGDKAVAFCPYGIGDIVEPREDASNITNYGNPDDPVFMENYSHHIGEKKFVFNANNFIEKYKYNYSHSYVEKTIDAIARFHYLQNYGDIDFATEDISGEDYVTKMARAYDTKKMSAEESLIYESIARQIAGINYFNSDNSNNCPGYVNVRSYMREGKEVSGYTRNCPYHN